ncbi:hypothetical protein JADG_006138 [Aureobasidium aubasidani]|nr:hypothetical protein JADG_006138 [Aureobasidium pullulans]
MSKHRPDMEHTTMIAPGALHFVPSGPRSDPAPAVILPPNDTNHTSEQNGRPVQGAAGSKHDEMQMNIDLAHSSTETSNQPFGLVTTDSGMQMDVDTVNNITETNFQAPAAEEPQSSPSRTDSTSHYTTSKPVREAEPEATNSTSGTFSEPVLTDVESSDDITPEATAILEDIQTRPVTTSIESEIFEPASLSKQSEDAFADATATPRNTEKIPIPTNIEPKAMEPAPTEPATTEVSTIEESTIKESEHARPTEPDPTSASNPDIENDVAVPEGSPKDVSSKKPSAEDTHMQDTSNRGHDLLMSSSPTDSSTKPAVCVTEADQPQNMDFEVHRLQVKYDPSNSSSQSSDKERGREDEIEANTEASAQESETLPDVGDDHDMVTAPADNSNIVPSSVSPPTEGAIKPVGRTSVRPSLFGGAAGPLNEIVTVAGVSPEAETSSKVDASADFDYAAETDPASTLSAENAEFLNGTSDPLDAPVFTSPWDLSAVRDEFDFKSGVESDTEAGADTESLDAPPETDEDAKPDMNALAGNIPHTPSHPLIRHNRTNTAMEFMDVDNLYPEVTRTGDGEALEGLAEEADNVPDIFKQLPIPKQTPEPKAPSCSCGHCRSCKYGLRPMENDGCTNDFGNHIVDTDDTGDFKPQPEGPIKQPKRYKSKKKIADVEMEDGEEVEERDADIEMFDKTIPYNQNDPVITDKQSYEDEFSDDDDAFNTKGKKRARAGAPGSSRPTKRAKKMVTKEVVKEPTTILETIQRLSTPKTTKLSYPITFDGGIDTCCICKRYNYAILGLGVRKIKVYDYGKGKGPVEIPDAIEAGLSSQLKRKPAATSLCIGCTVSRMQILMCKKHAIEPLDPAPTMDIMATLTRLIHNEPPSEDEVWCSICPSPARYTCCAKTVQGVKGCGLKVCATCAVKLQTTYEGKLGTMLKYLDDEVTEDYKAGLRADVELLRMDGPLERYMSLNSKGKGKAAA